MPIMHKGGEYRYTPGPSKPPYFEALNPAKGGQESESQAHQSRHRCDASRGSGGTLRPELGQGEGDANTSPSPSVTDAEARLRGHMNTEEEQAWYADAYAVLAELERAKAALQSLLARNTTYQELLEGVTAVLAELGEGQQDA